MSGSANAPEVMFGAVFVLFVAFYETIGKSILRTHRYRRLIKEMSRDNKSLHSNDFFSIFLKYSPHIRNNHLFLVFDISFPGVIRGEKISRSRPAILMLGKDNICETIYVKLRSYGEEGGVNIEWQNIGEPSHEWYVPIINTGNELPTKNLLESINRFCQENSIRFEHRILTS